MTMYETFAILIGHCHFAKAQGNEFSLKGKVRADHVFMTSGLLKATLTMVSQELLESTPLWIQLTNKACGIDKLWNRSIFLTYFLSFISLSPHLLFHSPPVWVLCHSLECGQIWDHIQTSRFTVLETPEPILAMRSLFYPWACCLGNVA